MTRLIEEDLLTISLKKYNEKLYDSIGAGLFEIAEKALNTKISKSKLNSKVKVIPITSGEGIIGGFSDSVASIIKFLGFDDCTVTKHSDVFGMQEAFNEKADIIFAADDDRYTGININTKKVRDNGYDTGIGYAAALDIACHGVKNKKVLVMGAGFVGCGAIDYLTRNGAIITVYDTDICKASELKKDYNIKVSDNLDYELKTHDLIVECTPNKDTIMPEYINKNTIISTPGIPLCISTDDVNDKGGLMIHDVLEIGTAVMALGSLM